MERSGICPRCKGKRVMRIEDSQVTSTLPDGCFDRDDCSNDFDTALASIKGHIIDNVNAWIASGAPPEVKGLTPEQVDLIITNLSLSEA